MALASGDAKANDQTVTMQQKENGVTSASSLITQKVVTIAQQASNQLDEATSQGKETASPDIDKRSVAESKKPKSRTCVVM